MAKREHQKNLPFILLQAFKESRFLVAKSQFTISPDALSQKHNNEVGIPNLRREKQISNPTLQKLKKILEREQELFARIRKYIIPLKKPPIDAIAVTVGPGLEPALWVGINFVKALSILWNIPLIPVNHMEGHIFSALLKKRGKDNFQFHKFQFPMLALLVSGGHTELVLIKNFGKYKIIGETLDDAAGEAFDKTARLLGLPYPGGPALSAIAEKKIKFKIPNFQIKLPRPMINSNDLNFSFSGLKTATLYLLRDLEKQGIDVKKMRPAIAKEFEDAAVEVLVSKTIKAAKKYMTKTVLLAGGVSANTLLRKKLSEDAASSGMKMFVSPFALTGDNALMIGIAGFFNQKKATKRISLLKAHGQLRLA